MTGIDWLIDWLLSPHPRVYLFSYVLDLYSLKHWSPEVIWRRHLIFIYRFKIKYPRRFILK